MSMECAQFEQVMHDLERPETQGFAERLRAFEHAESCANCGMLLEEVMSLDFALDMVAAHEANMQAPARVETALLAEFRRQHATVEQPQHNYWLAALGMAASVLLALGLAVGHWPGSATQTNATSNQTAMAGGANAAANASESAASDDSEYATNFVSLPYADDPGTLDGGTVVRVTLSRAALASFGVPVADLSTGDQIPADIALSVDGVPQAIRLVADADIDQTTN
jgi:hypothetical protein